jgi:mRNA interferase HicA
MKRREIERKLRELGWRFLKHGGNHDRWTNGKEVEEVPRHREIHEMLALKILNTAKRFPGPGK